MNVVQDQVLRFMSVLRREDPSEKIPRPVNFDPTNRDSAKQKLPDELAKLVRVFYQVLRTWNEHGGPQLPDVSVTPAAFELWTPRTDRFVGGLCVPTQTVPPPDSKSGALPRRLY